MAFNIKATLQTLQSKLVANGYFKGGALIGEPKSPPGERFTGAVFMSHVDTWLTLATLCAVHVVQLRVDDNMLSEPAEDVELEMSVVIDKIMGDVAGEFDLGATISYVDFGGIHGTPLSARWGYVDVGGTLYRVADITIPLVVNDVADMAP